MAPRVVPAIDKDMEEALDRKNGGLYFYRGPRGQCGAKHPGNSYCCTRKLGHTGDHIGAYTVEGDYHPQARWPQVP